MRRGSIGEAVSAVRKRAVAASVLASMGILTVGWQIGTTTAAPAISTSGGTASGTAGPSAAASSPTSAAPAAPAPAASTPAAATGSGLKDGTFTGASADTPFGTVQVAITVSGGKISAVKALKLTDQGGRSVQISNYAAPILRQEVLASQSTNVNNVNGATYTTDGYLTSVQSALDQAKA
jgi:uncharacterized protein with FMN-binding domain